MPATQSPAATCPQCGTADITGRFCPSCGTPVAAQPAAAAPRAAQPQPPRSAPSAPTATAAQGKQRPKWLPAALVAGVAAIAVALVAIVLLAFGDEPASTAATGAAPAAAELKDVTLAGQNLYAPRPGAGYVALMPAGWPTVKAKLDAAFGDAVVVRSAQDSSSTVTAGPLKSNSGSLKAAAASLTSGDDVQSSDRTGFSGRRAWRTVFTGAGLSQVAFLFDGCGRRYAVIGAAKPDAFEAVSARAGIVASSLQLTC